MPRTPLFALVERSLRLARAAAATGRSPGELVEENAARRHARREERLSRRELLGGSLALGAGLAAGLPLVTTACAGAPRPGSRAGLHRGRLPVLIVGAGIAGLTAGHRLRQAQVPVRILEAQGRTGGRMLSLRGRFAEGQVAELGGELIDTGHERIQALAAELGIALDDLAQEDPAVEEVWWFEGARRSEREVVEAFLPLVRRLETDRAAIAVDDVTYGTPGGAAALDRISIGEWLDRAGVAGWFRRLLEVAYTTEYGLEVGEQSALNLLLMIDPDPVPFRIFGDSDERFRVHAGNDAITAALAAKLEDAIELDTRLEAVTAAPDGTLRCSVRRGGLTRDLAAEHLILALPFTLLRDVRLDLELPPVKAQAIRELGYGTNAKLIVGFAERVWRTRHHGNGSVVADLPFQTTWETSRHQAGAAGILTNFTGGTHGVELGRDSTREQAARLVGDLERIFPGVAAARRGMAEVRFHWPTHPWSRGSYASYRVGQWTAFGGAEGEAVGNLHFAGEHCSRVAQGFMEGGCETGEAAAKEVLTALGVPWPLAAEARLRRAG